jgi:hypothetical protein
VLLLVSSHGGGSSLFVAHQPNSRQRSFEVRGSGWIGWQSIIIDDRIVRAFEKGITPLIPPPKLRAPGAPAFPPGRLESDYLESRLGRLPLRSILIPIRPGPKWLRSACVG